MLSKMSGIINQTLGMLPGNLDSIGHPDSRKPYRIHSGHLQTQHTPGTHTQDAIHTINNNGYIALCRDRASIQQTHWIPQGSMDNADTREPYNRQYAQYQAQWSPWAMDTRRHHTADTFDSTRHRVHHGKCKC